jgi:hypothetical protein
MPRAGYACYIGPQRRNSSAADALGFDASMIAGPVNHGRSTPNIIVMVVHHVGDGAADEPAHPTPRYDDLDHGKFDRLDACGLRLQPRVHRWSR